jgi:hypothetical protein
MVLVYKLDRFSRSLIDLKLTVEKLKKLKVDFISLQEKIETNSAAGNLFFNILGSFAEFERQIIGERTKFGMAKKARDGSVVNRAPLGYIIVNKKLVVDNGKALLAKQIFQDFIQTDLSLNKFAAKYNMTTRGMIKLLRNRTYLGELCFAGEWGKGEHQTVIEKETFNSAQSKLDSLTCKITSKTQITPEEIDLLLRDEDYRYSDPHGAVLLAVFINSGAVNLIRRGIGYIKPPAENELKKIKPPQQALKYLALNLFKKERVEFEHCDDVYVAGGKPDIIGKKDDKTILVECGPCRINKVIDFLQKLNTELWHVTNKSGEGAFVNIFSRGPKWDSIYKNYKDASFKDVQEEYQKVVGSFYK